MGCTCPPVLQRNAIPILRQGLDMVIEAPSGSSGKTSGKTIACAAACISHCAKSTVEREFIPGNMAQVSPLIVHLTATREQVERVGQVYRLLARGVQKKIT